MHNAEVACHRGRDGKEVRTRYVRRGQGPAVLLIHGVGMQAAVWEPQIAFLAPRFDVIAIDMLGHGGSSLPPEDVALADYADQVRSVLDAVGIESAHIVGHSMGALVALEFALSDAARVKSVVALNAVFRRNSEQRSSVAQRLAALEKSAGEAGTEQTIARWFGNPVPDKWAAAAERVHALLAEADPVGYLRTYRLFSVSDSAHEGRLPTLALPALFMTGEHDPNSSPSMSRTMAALAPHGSFDVVPGERHMMSLTAPDEVNRRLAAFFSRSEAGLDHDAADPLPFRRALGAFVTGVTVVATFQKDGEPRGFTANSFTSVSLDPPLVLICVAKSASSYSAFREAGHFSVNILSEAQTDVSRLFATPNIDRFSASAWRKGPAGSPILEGVAAWFDCQRHDAVEAGDHVILIGRVVGLGDTPRNPLGYCRGAHVAFGLPLGGKTAGALTVGAILEKDGRLLFVADSKGHLALPTGASLGPESETQSLAARLSHAGVKAELSFLFAVFEDQTSGAISIFYRGSLQDVSEAGGARLVDLDEIPWSDIRDEATRAMLRRYVRERQQDGFGVYMGGLETGVVKALARTG